MRFLELARGRFWMAFVLAIFMLGSAKANAEDYFWYYYPSPQAYLYVDDPIRYRTWEAQYGQRSVTVPGARVHFPFSETVYFGFNSCEVGTEYIKTIKGIADMIAANEAIAVLGGHTDIRGEADVNVRYGFCRAQSVVDLLEAFGIPTVQLNEVSHGAAQLAIEDAETEAEHSLNRRVTIDFTIFTAGETTTTTEITRAAGKWERRDYLGIWR